MSLENEVSALTGAVNQLVATYQGKEAEINAAVAAQKADVDAYIAAGLYTSRSDYVDALSGDDTNDGSAAAPLKTVAAALAKVMPNAVNTIRLRHNQTHTLTADVAMPESMAGAGGRIHFVDWGSGVDQAPTAASAVLVLQALIASPLEVVFGGWDAPITLRIEATDAGIGGVVGLAPPFGGGFPTTRVQVLHSHVILEDKRAVPSAWTAIRDGFTTCQLRWGDLSQTEATSKLFGLGTVNVWHSAMSFSGTATALTDLFTEINRDGAGAALNVVSNVEV